MNNELVKAFKSAKFGDIRVVLIGSKEHFVANDVAKSLGYKDTTNAIKQHCRRVVKYHIPHPQSNTKTLEVNVLPEGDLYRLITNSQLPSAEEFESWVFDDVIPSIRKTGAYNSKPLTPQEELRLHYQVLEEQAIEIGGIKEDITDMKENMPLFNCECKELQSVVKKVATSILGGYKTNAYNDKSTRSKVYSDIQQQIRREFGVERYEAIKRCQLEKAKEIVFAYRVPLILGDEIEFLNKQIRLYA